MSRRTLRPSATGGPVFLSCVYRMIGEIPEGTVMTSRALARALGHPRAARMVGYATSEAPGGIPSHRVVNLRGELLPGPGLGDMEARRRKLRDEGVPMLDNGRVDLAKARAASGAPAARDP